MNDKHEQADLERVLEAYRHEETPEPPPELGRRIRAYARSQSRVNRLASTRLVWPLSAAAALVVCLGVLVQMARHAPAPAEYRMPGSETVPPRQRLPEPEPTGAASRAPNYRAASGELSGGSEPELSQGNEVARVLEAEDWIAILRHQRDSGDTLGFMATLDRFRRHHPRHPLPEDLRHWSRENGLDLERDPAQH